MGDFDTILKRYLSDNERFADLFNGYLYQGEKIIDQSKLQEEDNELQTIHMSKGNQILVESRERDVVKKEIRGKKYIVLTNENQSYIDYKMPIRCMEYETMEYKEQLTRLKMKYEMNNAGLNSDEFLSKMKKKDRLAPVITLVVYYGKEPWDGSTDIHNLLELGDIDKQSLGYINNYKMNLFDYHNYDDFEMFSSDLREVFEFMKYANDKAKLVENIKQKRERYSHVESGTIEVIKVLTNTKILDSYIKKNEKEAVDMCKALDDLVYDSKREGMQEGIKVVVETCHELGVSREDTMDKLQTKFALLREQAIEYMGMYWHV